ncbi:MAG: hypothetical protein ACD_54C00509G0001 [uncultured bacterium]|nr:MAG: hypothetical protein ACD_54C00509G0001 [uncultured bacterium]
MRRRSAQPVPSLQRACKAQIGPTAPRAGADDQALAGLHSQHHPGAVLCVSFHNEAAAYHRQRHRAFGAGQRKATQ